MKKSKKTGSLHYAILCRTHNPYSKERIIFDSRHRRKKYDIKIKIRGAEKLFWFGNITNLRKQVIRFISKT